MTEQKHFTLAGALYSLLFFILFIITFSGINLNIVNARPVILIPAIVTVGYYYGEWKGFIAGIITGVFFDSVAAESICFNTVLFALIGMITGVLITYFFNRNLSSAVVLSVISSFLYFAAKYFIFYLCRANDMSSEYLIFYALPSAIYTCVFIFPFYFLGKFLNKFN